MQDALGWGDRDDATAIAHNGYGLLGWRRAAGIALGHGAPLAYVERSGLPVPGERELGVYVNPGDAATLNRAR